MSTFEHTHELFKDRLDFIDLDKEARTSLREVQDLLLQKVAGPTLDRVIAKYGNYPELQHMNMTDPKVKEISKTRCIKIWSHILGGEFDQPYVESIREAGQRYSNIGLRPRWLIGQYGLVAEAFIQAIIEENWPRLLRKPKTNVVSGRIAALVKGMLLDIDATISTYLELVEEKRQHAEEARKRVEADQATALQMVAAALDRLATGDLATRMTGDITEEFKKLQSDFNRAAEGLKNTIGGVAQSADALQHGIAEINQAADDLSRRTEQQAAGIEQTAAALEEITATIQKAAQGTVYARDAVALTQTDAERGGEIVRNAIDAMSEIEKSSQQIGQIIGVIDEIAFQTNLLALNAGVEAARAGEAGRGFAVVASEVRALAQRSAEAAKEIKTLVTTSSQQVGQGVDLVGETGKALDRIDVQVKELAKIITEITAGTQEQATGLKEVNTAVNQMDQVTQQNAAMVEQTTAACHALAQETEELARLVGHFETGNPAVAPLRRAAPKAKAPQAKVQQAVPQMRSQPSRNGGNLAKKPQPAAAEDSWEEF